jgi:hypothetical protein
MYRRDVLTKKRLAAYLTHRHQLLAALVTLIDKVPATGLKAKKNEGSEGMSSALPPPRPLPLSGKHLKEQLSGLRSK